MTYGVEGLAKVKRVNDNVVIRGK